MKLLISFYAILFMASCIPCEAHELVEICINKTETRTVTNRQARRLVRKGKAKRRSCASRFVTICRRGKRTVIVNRKHLAAKLARGDTIGRCVCTTDIKVCKDSGFIRRRDWMNKCMFEPCPCSRDLFECPDGTLVGRDGFNNCRFEPCPNLHFLR